MIALDERTYLTIVFPLAPHGRFHSSFAEALAQLLGDFRLEEEIVRAESAAIEYEPLVRLANRNLADTLNDLGFFLQIELDYHEDLRIVQLNLNDIPHPNRDPCVPFDAVRELFETAASKRSLAAH